MPDTTSDSFFNGRLRVSQGRTGYRFSIDAVLLAHFVDPGANQHVMDLGTGCGIIPLILAFRHPTIHCTGVEIQGELANLAADNVSENHLSQRIRIVNADVKTLPGPGDGPAADLVVCNPPYRRKHSGRVNPNHQKALARHEIRGALSDFVTCARRLLPVSGQFAAIYPAERLVDLLGQMRSADIEPKCIQPVHSFADATAKRVLVSGTRGGRPGAVVQPPLVIYREAGQYTAAVAAMFA